MVLASLLKMHNTYFCIYAGGAEWGNRNLTIWESHLTDQL